MEMKISVIIPIYNAEKYLGDLFNSLLKNEFEDGDEILLVDNGSSDNSLQLCKECVLHKPELFKLFEYSEKAGSYAARNYAVQQAKGDVLVFTDADTKPIENWITILKENAAKGQVLAGRIILEVVEKMSLWENFDRIAHLNSEKNAVDKCVATANMAVMRDDFCMVGLFEERFSGGDYEWSTRASQKGLTIQFLEQAIVYHPTRKTFNQILKKEQRIAYGAGNHYKNANKSLVELVVVYLLKIFKVDTNIRYSKALYALGLKRKDILEFNQKFICIRFQQLLFAVKGYKMKDARKMDLK